jgi:hypothetical protein
MSSDQHHKPTDLARAFKELQELRLRVREAEMATSRRKRGLEGVKTPITTSKAKLERHKPRS